mgnify:CR=1 FL=1
MSQKPPFVVLEEAVATAYRQVRETVDAMRLDNNALRAIPALELLQREVAMACATHRRQFARQQSEFDALASRLHEAAQRQIETTRTIEKRWLSGIDAMWSINQVHPNLVVAFNEFRGKLM